MAGHTTSPALKHPERIHPALWRGSQLARPYHPTLATGFDALDQELPGQGWPLSALIEVMPAQNGIGEIQLLQPALAQLDSTRSIALVGPPYVPHFHCWVNWQLTHQRLLWVQPSSMADTLWATEQILKHNACSAVLCWADHVQSAALRRLHQAATHSASLFIMLRSPTAALQPSIAPLRLRLVPQAQGVAVSILKRRGPIKHQTIVLNFYPDRQADLTESTYVSFMDQRVPA